LESPVGNVTVRAFFSNVQPRNLIILKALVLFLLRKIDAKYRRELFEAIVETIRECFEWLRLG
jgi:hypothetical protein